MMLYSALARGSMGLVAAISGVLTALVPVAFSLGREAWLRDGYTPAHRLAGFALAAAAIWLVAYTPSSGDETSAGALEGRSTFDSHGFALAVAAGLSFGTMLVLMHFAAAHGVLQGLIEMRITSTALAALAGAFLWFSKSRRTAEPSGLPKSRLLALAVVVGILDTAGNLFYLFASNAGRMDVAAVLSSLYPAGTMALAAWLLKERTSKSQAAGMALAIAAILLISA
jgi:drug/metabolite transporter (DMT)-like permease